MRRGVPCIAVLGPIAGQVVGRPAYVEGKDVHQPVEDGPTGPRSGWADDGRKCGACDDEQGRIALHVIGQSGEDG
ncbi:hypothetical protein BG621_02220 [Parasaccharibacter apium]|nr:hypothetical protein BG621_02220 [Parasaccharibacter apium]